MYIAVTSTIIIVNICTTIILTLKIFKGRELYPIKEKSPLLTIASIVLLNISITIYPIFLLIDEITQTYSKLTTRISIIFDTDIGLLGFTFCIISKSWRLCYAFIPY